MSYEFILLIVSFIVNVIFAMVAIRQQGKSNEYQKQALAQAATIEQIKKFDEPTAFSMLSQARTHEQHVWELNYYVNKVQEQNPNVDVSDLRFRIGQAHGESDMLFDNMIRVYLLSGATLTDKKVDRWMKDGLIVDHQKPRIIGHIR